MYRKLEVGRDLFPTCHNLYQNCPCNLPAFFQETKVDTVRTGVPLNRALALYRVWQHGDIAWDDSIILAKETIESEAKLRNVTFEELLKNVHQAGQ
jgi:hypothetical protein